MRWREWNELPKSLQVPEVQEYYDILSKKKHSLRLKRCFDVVAALIMLICFSPIMLVISAAIVLDSPGGNLLSSGTCDTVWEDVSHPQIQNDGIQCR